ncbi:MAG: hypothetical protein IT162_13550 [Bryobacterales bacterium]|nr:hypothetical protein [Bryobacterales bacterium]
MRVSLLPFYSALVLSVATAAPKNLKSPKAPAGPVHGVKTPGVLIPMADLKSDAEVKLDAPVAGLLAAGENYVVGSAQGLRRYDGKTNEPLPAPRDLVPGVKGVCGSMLLNALGATWALVCDQTSAKLAKVELPAGGGGRRRSPPPAGESKSEPAAPPKPPAFLALDAVPFAPTALAATEDSLWLLADSKTSLQRIDPKEMKIVSELRLPAGCTSILPAESALWVTCPGQPSLLRLDARTGDSEKRIEVPAEPVAVVAGEGSLWVLCRKDGKVARVDPKTNKVTATIELGIPGASGALAFGEGYLWASVPGFPLMRIAPATDKAVQQFHGEGGGVLYFAAGSLWVGAPGGTSLARFDPKRVLATLAE